MFQSHTPTTPIDVDRLEWELRQHPDQVFVRYLCTGCKEGFDTMISSVPLSNIECKNLLSARRNPLMFKTSLSQNVNMDFCMDLSIILHLTITGLVPLVLQWGNILGRND